MLNAPTAISFARDLLRQFKGDHYLFGLGCLSRLGELVRRHGTRAAVICSAAEDARATRLRAAIDAALQTAGIQRVGAFIAGAQPNAPREDVFRMQTELADRAIDVVIAAGGGSTIDAAKAAIAYQLLHDIQPELDAYFGMGQVAEMLARSGRRLTPMVAVQTAASSAAHLTKYANITNMRTGQKLLIVDDAVTPPDALFDYTTTTSMSRELTMDGAFDGISHSLEVLMGIPATHYAEAQPVCLTGIELIVANVRRACDAPEDTAAREALGLGTDLGGYAIMIGGTNGAHLNSFSFTDILPHGRACALMNPYYVVFFAPAIEERLRAVADIYSAAGVLHTDCANLHGRDLGLAVAEGMMALSRTIGFPTKLRDVPGFSDEHIARALTAAKNPKLASKLQNMPVPLDASAVDAYMGPVLQAATCGDLRLIKNMPM